MSEQTRELVRRYFEELLTAPTDMAVADQIFTDDVTFRNPISAHAIEGIDEYKAFVQRWVVGFPDRVFTIDELLAEDDRAAAQFTITATHGGEFLDVDATGNRIEVHGMNMFHTKDGRIQRVQAFFDDSAIRGPLGLE